MSPEPKKTPENPGALYKAMRDPTVPPHERFALWQREWGMTDGELADVLELTRPEVQRTREAVRPPSFTICVRVETVMGIPCGHWREVPANVRLRADWYALTDKAKTKRKPGGGKRGKAAA